MLQADNYNAMKVTPHEGKNPKTLHEHQFEAIQALDRINEKQEFKSVLVLPTGGGKTLTAVWWLLKNAVDQKKKVLWLAHRHLLLEQAADTFRLNAYVDDLMVNKTEFTYRIISGVHDKPIHIKKSDDILIASKDSIVRSLDLLNPWLKGEEIFLVIDEAHHAAARTYRTIIDYVYAHAAGVKMLGLTATPERTSEKEKGALKEIFSDDIVYKIDLDTLIKREILSNPHFTDIPTDIKMGQTLGISAIRSIEQLDKIPDDVAKKISMDSLRNRLIVDTYFKDYKKYGQTLVFALNIDHAIELNAIFNKYGKKYGVRSAYIVSSIRDAATGITISNQQNEENIEEYKKGNIQVLINVNILTEGTDLPKTQTVFLTRPTVSSVLMTQMVGRALRGPEAGGTSDAYIVSFVDDWDNKIMWISPEELFEGSSVLSGPVIGKKEREIRYISIAKMEEFARLADDFVDTSKLEGIPCMERIPVGMYVFSFMDSVGDESMERNYQILVYSNSKASYEHLLADMEEILEMYGVKDEQIEPAVLESMLDMISESYFDDHMIPPYNRRDIEALLKFFAQKGNAPAFVEIEELNRKRLDVSEIAKTILDRHLGRGVEEPEYLKEIWNEPGSIVPIYYSQFYFFRRMIDIEIEKMLGVVPPTTTEPQSEAEKRNVDEMTLQDIIEKFPTYGIELKERVFAANRDKDGYYTCMKCGKKQKSRRYMEIDHIQPYSKSGKTVFENLQILCHTCNEKEGDKS